MSVETNNNWTILPGKIQDCTQQGGFLQLTSQENLNISKDYDLSDACLMDYSAWGYVSCTINTVAMICNILTLLCIAITPALKTPFSLLIANINVINILTLLVDFIGRVNNLFTGKFIGGEDGCVLITWLFLVLITVEIYSHLVVALNRYFAVVHFSYYHQVTALRIAIRLVAVNWALPIVVLAAFIGLTQSLGTPYFNEIQALCTFTEDLFSALVVARTLLWVLPFAGIPACLMAIFWRVKNREKELVSQNPVIQQVYLPLKKEIHITKMMAAVLVLFTATHMPLFFLIPRQQRLWLMVTNICPILTPAIYAISNEAFRKAYLHLLHTLMCIREARRTNRVDVYLVDKDRIDDMKHNLQLVPRAPTLVSPLDHGDEWMVPPDLYNMSNVFDKVQEL